MTGQSRLAMLVGLAFIIAFALVINDLMKDSGASAALRAPGDERAARRYAPVLELPPAGEVPPEALASGEAGRPAQELARHSVDPCSVIEVEVVRRTEGERAAEPPGDRREAATIEPPPPPAPPARKHIVKPRDSLIKIARLEYGPENERHYVLIRQANKDLLKGEDTLLVGMELVIPPLPASPAPSPPPAGGPPPAVAGGVPLPRAEPAPPHSVMGLEDLRRAFGAAPSGPPAPGAAGPAPEPAKQYYVTRRGDSLAKIAREKLHDDSLAAVRKLYAANKDKLRDPDELPVGMKLLIPT